MRIALTFNSLESTNAIARTLASLGHTVTPVDVTRPVDAVIAELSRLAPDLVFNVADSTPLYPALFEHLGIAHTGSDASTIALCKDRALAKRIVAASRVSTPAAQLVRSVDELAMPRLPAILKGNVGGAESSIVVTDEAALQTRLAEILPLHADGVLVEHYVEGRDVAVGWVEGLGLLVQLPSELDAVTSQRLLVVAQRAFAALDVRGYGCAHFRVAPEGGIYFLEMNPLPSLGGLCALAGTEPRELFAHIVDAGLRDLRSLSERHLAGARLPR